MLRLGDMLMPLLDELGAVARGQRSINDALLFTVNKLRPLPESKRVSDRMVWVYQRKMVPAVISRPDLSGRVHLRDLRVGGRCLCGGQFEDRNATDIVTGSQRWCYPCVGQALMIIEEEERL